jgi:hypothetical protein
MKMPTRERKTGSSKTGSGQEKWGQVLGFGVVSMSKIELG